MLKIFQGGGSVIKMTIVYSVECALVYSFLGEYQISDDHARS